MDYYENVKVDNLHHTLYGVFLSLSCEKKKWNFLPGRLYQEKYSIAFWQYGFSYAYCRVIVYYWDARKKVFPVAMKNLLLSLHMVTIILLPPEILYTVPPVVCFAHIILSYTYPVIILIRTWILLAIVRSSLQTALTLFFKPLYFAHREQSRNISDFLLII